MTTEHGCKEAYSKVVGEIIITLGPSDERGFTEGSPRRAHKWIYPLKRGE